LKWQEAPQSVSPAIGQNNSATLTLVGSNGLDRMISGCYFLGMVRKFANHSRHSRVVDFAPEFLLPLLPVANGEHNNATLAAFSLATTKVGEDYSDDDTRCDSAARGASNEHVQPRFSWVSEEEQITLLIWRFFQGHTAVSS
jgi:hypothetical protein